MTSTIIGIDIAKLKFDVARLAEGKYKHAKFANNLEGFAAFAAWLDGFGDTDRRLCLEATGAYGLPLAEFLADGGYFVSVVNPAQIHAFGKSELSRAKTDKADAKLIARYALQADLVAWKPLPANLRQLQALTRRLEHLLEMQRMEQNRLETADTAIVPSINTVLATLAAELKATRQAIQDHVDKDPDLKQQSDLLTSIPGIGPATTAYLLVALSPHHGYANAKQVVAQAGLAPAIRQSGQWQGKTRIAKTGDARLRKALYLPALVAWQHNPAIRVQCQRLKANGKNGKLIVCAAMRKLIHLAFAILKSGKPFDPNFSLA
ncbi:IS110 family transposase [Methylomonas sp. MO1]|uniref:IS110 family transposase n=1 Tax=unclassified Methylomonas TaxID=2608980 RepID=UPI00047C11FC|nr:MULTISPECIES: IS110 family transposase [unclassified Methylomonas]MDT4288005.1 IS110 family transposase [Methylomonas sp. MO1]MDT4288629.1 IS110 family transposase [Methylomonas sp. MO1]MDT4289390.1 IS110 family transposase [Methylomonas sp. MO1]